MKHAVYFECGDTTCASEPGKFCKFLLTKWGEYFYCSLFDRHSIYEDEALGWLLRCPPCMKEYPNK